MQSIIVLNAVSYELPTGKQLFENLNLTLSAGLTALVGPNGVGKTTLAKLIAGELTPTRGAIRRSDVVGIFHQHETPLQLTVEEYLSTGYSWSLLGAKLLNGIDMSLLCSQLSGGQWMKVRLAAAIRNQFLILDEPSNDLDNEAKTILIDFLHGYQKGVLLISHDREILNLCEDILELSSQGLVKYGCGFCTYERAKEAQLSKSLVDLNRAKAERNKALTHRTEQVEKQNKRNREGKKLAIQTGMARILIGARKRRAQETTGRIDVSTLEVANEKVSIAYNAFKNMKIDPVMYGSIMGAEIPAQKLVAEAKDYNVRFGEKWLYAKDLNFTWRGSVRIAIKGRNGSGKTSLIKGLLGELKNTRGQLKFGELETLYLDQRCSILDESKSVLENVRNSTIMLESEVRNNLAKLLFFGDSVYQVVHSLSGGERLRAALACGLLSKNKPELIIFDEPTNNLDLQNIRFIEKLISQFKGAVVIISHDEVFLNECGVNQMFYV